MLMQDSLKLTSEQKADMVKLRAVCLAKQAENQAQWHHLCDAIAQVIPAGCFAELTQLSCI